jgi:MaoC like domain
MADRTWHDPQGRFFEDFAVGDRVVTRGRTVDIGDIATFAGLTGDHYPLHTDQEFAKTTRFETRIAHGPLTFARHRWQLHGCTGTAARADKIGRAKMSALPLIVSQFREALAGGDLIVQKCEACGKLNMYLRYACPFSQSLSLGWHKTARTRGHARTH